MTPVERIDHYDRTLPYPRSLFLGGDSRIVGTWIIGVIGMVKSTNHRFRVVTLFERTR